MTHGNLSDAILEILSLCDYAWTTIIHLKCAG
jgi:hypothetical protein